jgi:hypothetical protein
MLSVLFVQRHEMPQLLDQRLAYFAHKGDLRFVANGKPHQMRRGGGGALAANDTAAAYDPESERVKPKGASLTFR